MSRTEAGLIVLAVVMAIGTLITVFVVAAENPFLFDM